MKTILTPKKSDTVRFSAKISPKTAAEIDTVLQRIKSVAPDVRLDLDGIVDETLARAARRANKELDEYTKQA